MEENGQNIQNDMDNLNNSEMNNNPSVATQMTNNMENPSINNYSSDIDYQQTQMNQGMVNQNIDMMPNQNITYQNDMGNLNNSDMVNNSDMGYQQTQVNQGMINQNIDMMPNQMGNGSNEMIPNMQQNQGSFNAQNNQPQPVITNNTYKSAYQGNDEKKQRFKYQIINDQGNKETGYIDAINKEDLQNYLANEGYQVVSIKAQNNILNMSIGGTKMKYSDLAFVLTQLSTYLKAGIPLIDSVKILEKQSVKSEQKKIFANITYELVRGESFSYALERQGNTFPKLLINMIKTAELTGDLPSILDDMTEYYTSIDRTRKQVVSAMTYPIIIFIFALAVITFILLYIVPEFVKLFEQNNAEIPALTTFVINASDFLTHNFLYVLGGGLLLLLVYSLCFKKVKPFRKAMQTLFMHLPIVGNIMIYKEVNMFTKTFASLLNHDVFITDSMAILGTVSSNEVFKEIIQDSLDYLSRGAKISDSFKGKWAFPIVAYEMLVTGENTGRLPMMMDYVAKYYGDLHSNYIKRLNTFIEPVMILLLAIIVGIVVLSVIIPMFSFYSQISY